MTTIVHRLARFLRAELESRLDGWERRVFEGRADGQGQGGAKKRSRTTSGDRRYADSSRRTGADGDSSSRGSPASDGVDPALADYYANLELPYGAGPGAVREAWKRLVRRYHPDLHGRDPERQKTATELVQGLNHAYEQLRNHFEKTA